LFSCLNCDPVPSFVQAYSEGLLGQRSDTLRHCE
jgi:hypothetical protein